MIIPMFQPLNSTRDSGVVGGELLCRWFSQGAVLLPYQFPEDVSWAHIDLEALSFIANSSRAINEKFKSVYINISKEVMESDLLFSEWEGKVKELNLTEKIDVSFEVLESVTDSALCKRWHNLSSLGGKIVMDDFGSLNSNFNRLERHPWDACKFNIHKIGAGSSCDIKALSYCLNRGITTIAERVETPLDATLCANKGIHIQQGYLYGKASPLGGANNSKLVDLKKAIAL